MAPGEMVRISEDIKGINNRKQGNNKILVPAIIGFMYMINVPKWEGNHHVE